MSCQIEPLRPGEESHFLSGLNRCFSNWGDTEQFDWVYRRDSGAGAARLFLARDAEGEIVGGTGVTFRRATDSRGVEARLAIMTGSWVLPTARKQGCFTQLIEVMLDTAKQSHCAMLLGFCFKANGSYNRLLNAGFGSVDTAYLRDPVEYESTSLAGPLEALSVGDRTEVFVGETAAGAVAFTYSRQEWEEQFLHGPYPKAFLELPGRGTAAVEEAHGFHRLLALSLPEPERFPEVLEDLWARARSRSQRLFLFSTDQREQTIAKRSGLEEIPGAFIYRIACRQELSKWVDSTEDVQEADLSNPSHPAYLGGWRFQNRDRM